MLGALPSFLRDPLTLLRRAREAGDVSRLELGFLDAIMLHHPDHIDRVFRTHHRNYLKEGPFWEGVREVFGNGLPTSEGEQWRLHRRMMQPQFHRQRIMALANLVIDALHDALSWSDVSPSWQTLELGRRMPHLTMSVVSATIFGSHASRQQSESIASDMRFVANYTFKAMLAHRLPRWVPFPGRERYAEAMVNLDREVRRIIEERRQRGEAGDDLLGLLIAATDDETGTGMTDEQLIDETKSLLLAGYDTTANGLQWCLHLLAEHPELLGRLREECDSVLHGSMPRPEDVRRLPYARWVMQEALRLYPPTWWLPRVAAEDDEIGGHAIPKGSVVAPVMFTVHRHPAFWSNPDRFDPERFSPERSVGRHPLAWVPFGAGPRKCIGQELALMEATFALAMLTQRYEIASSGREVRPKIDSAIRPADGVRLRIRLRKPARRSISVVRPRTSDSSTALMM